MTRKTPEADLQFDIVNYLNVALTPSHFVAAIPNASRRTFFGHAANAVAGLYPGMPDLMIVGPLGRCAFIEVKADRGRLSDVQQAVHARLATMGVPHCIARSLDDVRAALVAWGIPTRESKSIGRAA